MPESGQLILEKYREAASQDAGENQYGGLRIHALEGVHELVGSVAARVFEAGSSILDLASGSGAMCLRLKDIGLHPTGSDLVEENFRLLQAIPFINANLNQDFPAELADSFDGITAIEIIEHLENPRHFLRQCFSILKPGGYLILTTPNIDNAFSRATWVRLGYFRRFSQREYRQDGHITPLPLMVLRNAMTEAGFRIVKETSVGEREISRSWWKMSALAALLKMLDSCDTPQKEILIVLAQRS